MDINYDLTIIKKSYTEYYIKDQSSKLLSSHFILPISSSDLPECERGLVNPANDRSRIDCHVA